MQLDTTPTRPSETTVRKRYDKVAVLIPCLNEELTIASVVEDFKAELPGAAIYVFDNNSTDKTAEVATRAGAVVVASPRRGKGYVIQHMFHEVEADMYVMADGDGTYPAKYAPSLVDALVRAKAEMVVGTRVDRFEQQSFRRFHIFGNKLVAGLISKLFGMAVNDVMSGYRVFSRDFVKTVPLMSPGFEIETEMTLQAAAKGLKLVEAPISYGTRPEGSHSKLNTYSDGFLVLKLIFMIFKDFKPLIFFSGLSVVLAGLSVASGLKPILDFYKEGFVYHVPLAILATAFGILATLSLAVGLILDTVGKYHRENFELLRRALRK